MKKNRKKWIVAGAILGILGFICVPIVKASWNNTGAWQGTADSGGGDNVSVNGAAVVDPDFTSGGNVALTNTANVITANVPAASTTASGISELAITSEIDAGTDTARAMPIDQFEESAFARKIASILVNDSTVLTTGDGKAYFRAPDILNGWSITSVRGARVAGNDNIQIQLYNVTQGTDTLSTALWIDGFEKDSTTAGTSTAINAAEDDLTTADRFRIDVDIAGTDTTWLEVQVEFERVP